MQDNVTTRRGAIDTALERVVALDWEKLAWLAIVVLTLVTRLWDLGDRAMSHDESLHTFYSWKLFIGEGYRHDPMMHGPLLYHATALSYFLFGASDLTARLVSVVTGLGLVLSPLLVRKWLGRIGALAAGLILLVSPTVMYYSRYIRHDIHVQFFTALMAVSFFQYLRTRSGRWVVIAFAAAAGGITSAEMAYINGFILVVFIALAMTAERLGSKLADALSVALGAIGLGSLIFAAAVWAGVIGDLSDPDLPMRTAMHIGFLLGGLGLIYSLTTGLVARFGSDPDREEAADKAGEHLTFADFTVDRFFPRYGDVRGALLPLVSGLVVAAFASSLLLYLRQYTFTAIENESFGVTLLKTLLLMPGLSLATDPLPPDYVKYILGAAQLLLVIGAAVALYGLIALVLGQLASRIGRRVNVATLAIGLLVLLVSWFWSVGLSGAEKAAQSADYEFTTVQRVAMLGGLEFGDMGLVLRRLATLLIWAGALFAIYGFLSWLLEGYRSRKLALAVGSLPANVLGAALAVLFVAYALLFTTFFTQPDKLTGLLDSVSYWLAQHEVVRGDQPYYYYAVLLPMYEYLPLLLGLAAGVVYSLSLSLRVGRGNEGRSLQNPALGARLFVPFFIAWAAGAFWIFSWAGEKMPWLLVHLVVPLAFLSGRMVADLIDTIDWKSMREHGWQFGSLLVLTLIAVGTWMTRRPFQGETQEALSRTAGWLLGVPVIALLLWALFRVASRMSRRQATLAGVVTLLAALLVLNVRYSLMANFINDELATEYIVYAHGTPDDKLVYETLRDMQLRLGVDRPMSVGYDNEVSWPYTWYFRHTDWADARYLGENISSKPDVDVLLVGSPNYSKFEPYLRDEFEAIEYRRMWWPNEGYKFATPEGVLQGLVDPNARRNWLRILLYREYTLDPTADSPEPKPLTDWYHHANMRLYVKKDLIPKLWPLAKTLPEAAASIEPGEAPPQAELAIELRYEDGPDGEPLVGPKDIALAPDGSLYVVDHENFRVVRFDPDGTPTEVIADGRLEISGEPGKGSAWGIGVAPDGAVYIADTWNHRIMRYVDGKLENEWGSFGQPDPAAPLENGELFYGPRDAEVGPDGNVYVTDTGNKRITAFTPEGRVVRSFGIGFQDPEAQMDPGAFDEPTSLAFDPATGDIFVADLWNQRVQRFDSEMNYVLEWPVDGWDSQQPAHKAYIAVGPGSTVAISDPAASRVWLYDNEGSLLTMLDLLQDQDGLDEPIGVAIDAQGRVYVASSISGLVTRYAPPKELLEAAELDVSDAGEEGEASGEAVEGEQGAEGEEGEGAAEGAGEAAESSEEGDEGDEGLGGEEGAAGEASGAEESGSAGDDESSPGEPPEEGGSGDEAGSGDAGGG